MTAIAHFVAITCYLGAAALAATPFARPVGAPVRGVVALLGVGVLAHLVGLAAYVHQVGQLPLTGLGPSLLLKGFAAASVGGIGNNRGALLAGYIIGIVEAVAAAALSPGYQLAATFAVMLGILLIRPHGLFGRAEARAV